MIRLAVFLLVSGLLIAACTSWTQEDGMQMFRGLMEYSVMMKDKIDGYLQPGAAVKVVKIEKVKPGVVEYFFEEKHAKLFRSSSEKCRFIFIVDKKTRTIVDWKYNGNPDYCTANP